MTILQHEPGTDLDLYTRAMEQREAATGLSEAREAADR